jgi:hypothetical protein
VWAPSCAAAEVAATTALLAGTRAVADAPSVIVATDGTLHHSVTANATSRSSAEQAA